jgi:hypothetical protein
MLISSHSAWKTSMPILHERKHISRRHPGAMLPANRHRGGKDFPAICHARR